MNVPDAVIRAAERLATPLDPSRVEPGMRATNQADIDSAQLILAYLRGSQSAPSNVLCPVCRTYDCEHRQSTPQGESVAPYSKWGVFENPPAQPDVVRDALLRECAYQMSTGKDLSGSDLINRIDAALNHQSPLKNEAD